MMCPFRSAEVVTCRYSTRKPHGDLYSSSWEGDWAVETAPCSSSWEGDWAAETAPYSSSWEGAWATETAPYSSSSATSLRSSPGRQP